LFVEPYHSKICGLNLRPFGHAAVRYHEPHTQECIVANISKEKGVTLVEFWNASEWFYGIGKASQEQGDWDHELMD
jgi:hypothetical protein